MIEKQHKPIGSGWKQMGCRVSDTIKRFLADVFGADVATADEDACAIEHVISNDSIAARGHYLDSVWMLK